MKATLYELPLESTDGSRRTFTLRLGFVTGSTQVILRGLERRQADTDYGWTELPPNQVQLTTAPGAGDPLIIGYRPR